MRHIDFEGTPWFATAELHDNGLSVEYRIFDGENSDDPEDDLILEGFVKNDGCSNWSSSENGDYFHACGKQELLRVGEAMALCWEDAKQEMNNVWLGTG